MGKADFMRKLQTALRGTFSRGEVREILLDYEGFFVSGASEGKSEAQVIAELGEPENIALELSGTTDEKKPRPSAMKILAKVALVGVLSIIGIAYSFVVDSPLRQYAIYSIFLLVAFAWVLWFALGGTFRRVPSVPQINSKRIKQFLAAGHSFIFLAIVAFYFLAHFLRAKYISVDILSLVFGERLYYYHIAVTIITLLVAALAVVGFYRLSPQFFTVSVHALGAMVLINGVAWIYKNIDRPDRLMSLQRNALVIYAATALLVSLSALFIHYLTRRRAK